jgi:hypothetical protein
MMAYDKTKMQDINIADRNLYTLYKIYWDNNQFEDAFQLLTDNPQLKYKVLNAFNWNRFINLINDSTEALEWSGIINYKINDLTSYDGGVYLCIKNNTNIIPTNIVYWTYLYDSATSTPATYDSLVGMWNTDYVTLQNSIENAVYLGEWNSTTEYSKNNLVQLDGSVYFALQDSTNQNPKTATSYWNIVQTNGESFGLPVSTIEPSGMEIQDIYIKEIT